MSEPIAQRLSNVRDSIADACARAQRAENVTLVAVSKTVSPSAVLEAYEAGQRVFGENRVQEAVGKQAALGDRAAGATWHLIGHLQTNKAKAAVQSFSLLQSIDTVRLAQHVDRLAAAAGVVVPVLFEINVAGETSKSGFTIDEIVHSFPSLLALRNIEPKGLMTIAPLVEDVSDVRPVFRSLRLLRDRLADGQAVPSLSELSMGMSNDYTEAIQEGATIVRIGRAIFGDRPT